MLYKFLVENREKILAVTREKIIGISENKPTTEESERGLPEFYDHMLYEMKRESQGLPKSSEKSAARKHGQHSTTLHGKELSRLGYTVSQVVHGYGVLCQAITELADARRIQINAREFSVLNLSLDIAIADAVTGFAKHASVEIVGSIDSAKRTGVLAHELRNALAATSLAHALIKKGVVGAAGSTNALLESNLNRMRDLIDGSFAELRMQTDKVVNLQSVLLIQIVEEVEATASQEANLKGLTIKMEVPRDLHVNADRHYLVSALSNLVQNAIKYSKQNGIIWVRGRDLDKDLVLEVEDQCGGLPKGKFEELSQSFSQKRSNRASPKLSISREAVSRNGGTLTVHDSPGKGCIFSITLPKREGLPLKENSHAL